MWQLNHVRGTVWEVILIAVVVLHLFESLLAMASDPDREGTFIVEK